MGREASQKGSVYDFMGEHNPDQWIKTTHEIRSYVGQTYTKYTDVFTKGVEELALATSTLPTNPNPTNLVAFEIWKLDIKDYWQKEQEYSNFRAGLYSLAMG